MKFNRLLLAIWILCLAFPTLAQQPDAKDIMDRTAEVFRNAGGIKAAFTVRSPQGTSNGVICLKGERFLLETEGMTTWFDGKTQWTYVESNDEVNVSEPTPEELQSINPYTLLYMYKQGYKLKLGKLNNDQDRYTNKIVLTSTDRKQDLQCIILYVAKKTLRPLRVSMAQRNGDTVIIIINSYQTGQAYSDSFFVFDKKAYPEAEVIDLR